MEERIHMKITKFEKKLSLKKTTISNLNHALMQKARGGAIPTFVNCTPDCTHTFHIACTEQTCP